MTPTDWTMFLLLILFLAMLVAGFFISFVHIIDGVLGFFFALKAWDITQALPLTVVIFGLACSVLLFGIFHKTPEFAV